MKHTHAFLSLTATVLAALAPTISSGQPVSSKAKFPIAKADLFAPQFHSPGNYAVVQLAPSDGGREPFEKMLRVFGSGALAQKQAQDFAATIAGPVVVKRVLKHYRCPGPGDDSIGGGSDFDCEPVNIGYTQPFPPDPPSGADFADCGINVDVDVLFLGWRAKTVRWQLSPASPMVTTTAGAQTPRVRLVDRVVVGGEEIRGITFSDNTDDPRERGMSPPTTTRPVFDFPGTAADGQSVVWTRASDARRGLRKAFYYSVVMEVWSDSRQDYVYCTPYDPTVVNRGN